MANAAEAHLQRIVGGERANGLKRLSLVRAGAAVAALATAVGFGVLERDAGWRAAMVPTAVYCAVAMVLVALSRSPSRLVPALALSVALIDVPAVTLVQWSGMAGAPERFLFGPALGLYCALVVASALLLSSGVVAATCASVLACQAALYAAADAPASEHAIILIAPVGTAALCVFLVGRIRALVAEARRDDVMGKYLLGRRIGIGGMAEVFQATYAPEGGFERQVALKRVLPQYAADLHFIDRFRREAELTAQLVHPNVVQVLDFGYHRDTYFLAMELVDGVPLARLLKEPLPLCVATYLGLQLAEALDYIHGKEGPDGRPLGLVHRDVNPPNVLVSRHGEVKLADFGVARASSGAQVHTATGMVVGKRSYLSPEQLRAEAYDSRADLFALGLTLYEVVAGRRAFDTSSEVAIIKALLEGNFIAPSQVRAEVPAPLDAVVLGLMERDPARRTPTAAALREQLVGMGGAAAPFPDGKRLLGDAVVRAGALPEVEAPKAASVHSGATRTRTTVPPSQ